MPDPKVERARLTEAQLRKAAELHRSELEELSSGGQWLREDDVPVRADHLWRLVALGLVDVTIRRRWHFFQVSERGLAALAEGEKR